MRVVAGVAGGRRLVGPVGKGVRPTTDKVREAVFNSLQSMGAVEECTVLDLFAGTGACGIEALSRGATTATFVDNDRRAADVIRRNLDLTDLVGEVIVGDALKFVSNAGSYDLVFADPPYVFDAWTELLKTVDSEVIVCESNRPIDVVVGDRWENVRCRRYGDTTVTILRRQS